MIYGVFSYRDNKSSFGQIWYDRSVDAAKRGFAMMVNQPDGIMGFAPSDFDLFKIAEFDSVTGQLDPIWPIEFIVNGRDLLGEKE